MVRAREDKPENYFTVTNQRGILGQAFSKGAGEIDDPLRCVVGLLFTEQYKYTFPDGTWVYRERQYQRNYCTGLKVYN